MISIGLEYKYCFEFDSITPHSGVLSASPIPKKEYPEIINIIAAIPVLKYTMISGAILGNICLNIISKELQPEIVAAIM